MTFLAYQPLIIKSTSVPTFCHAVYARIMVKEKNEYLNHAYERKLTGTTI